MKKIIVLTGTPGAGKTTVLEGALQKFPDCSILNYADVMLDVGKSLGLGNDHDAIRKLPLNEQRVLQKKAAEQIAKDAKGMTIVDTHCAINTPNGYLPGLPEWVIKALSPQVIIVVEADPEEIAGRRTKDLSRKRDKEETYKIKLQQDVNRTAAFAYAALCGATVKIIENHNNKLNEAVGEMEKLLKNVGRMK